MVTLAFAVAACLRAFFVSRHKLALETVALGQQLAVFKRKQTREALPLPCSHRYVVLDRDAKFGGDILEFLKASGIRPIRTSVRSPWQNGIAERLGWH